MPSKPPIAHRSRKRCCAGPIGSQDGHGYRQRTTVAPGHPKQRRIVALLYGGIERIGIACTMEASHRTNAFSQSCDD